MTDKEIIKALECCVSANYICPHTCPMLKNKECLTSLRKNALDLITRKQSEIENLKVENQSLRGAANSLKMHYEEAWAKIKRLEEQSVEVSKTIKSEAVKEFAERLKCGVPQEYGVIRCSDVDNLVKEMTGKESAQ